MNYKLFRTTDIIEIKIDSISIGISPLSYLQKNTIQPLMFKAAKDGDMVAAMDAVILSLKYSLKRIKGIQFEDDNGNMIDYVLEFENGELKQSCIDDLLNTQFAQKITTICSSLINGLSDKIVGQDGKVLEGVEIVGKFKENK